MALRGVESRHMLDRQRLFRDVRPFHIQFLETIRSFEAVSIIYSVLIVLPFLQPSLFELCTLVAAILWPIVNKTEVSIPLRKRKGLREIDQNDLDPGSGKPQMSRGIAFIGNRKSDSAEIWAANEDLRTHMFIVGSTGAGKTEGLISLSYNPMCWGSGFAYSDGKGDISFWGKGFSLVRSFGREDDLLVINYMTAGADTTIRRFDKLSNSYNPYQVGNSESLIQMTVSLMDASGAGSDMWKGRAISFLTSLIIPLCDLRDKGMLMLHIGVIRENMPLLRYVELMDNPNISERARDMMRAFLADVPGYNPSKTMDKQSSTFLEQYGYQQMQFTRIMSSLADTYGHIYAAKQAEVNLKDVVLNCRILLVLLPALEKSRPELGNLGKIVVSGMKSMMGTQLGGRIQGTKRDLLDARATNAPAPYLMIFDEFGYFMPEDTALMWAQARSLGFWLVAAGQDIQAFYRTSKEETLAIFGSSNIKILGKLEDPTDTLDLFSKLAGESYVSELDGYETDQDSIGGGYKTNQTAKINKVNRIDILDLKDQVEGEVHIFFKSEIIRARMFYAAPKVTESFWPNHFIEVLAPEKDEVAAISIDIKAQIQALEEINSITVPMTDEASKLAALKKTNQFIKYASQNQGAECGICLFIMMHNPDKYLTQDEDEITETGSTRSVDLNIQQTTQDVVESTSPSAPPQQAVDLKTEGAEEVELDDAFSETPQKTVHSPDTDPFIQAAIAGAEPLLNSVLFDSDESRLSVVTGLATAAAACGYQPNDATELVHKYEAAVATVMPEDIETEDSTEKMASALEGLDRIFS